MNSLIYEPPVVTDFGDLVALTAASGYRGPEDGMVKDPVGAVPHHSGPIN